MSLFSKDAILILISCAKLCYLNILHIFYRFLNKPKCNFSMPPVPHTLVPLYLASLS